MPAQGNPEWIKKQANSLHNLFQNGPKLQAQTIVNSTRTTTSSAKLVRIHPIKIDTGPMLNRLLSWGQRVS